jgi:hypothetical protein
MINPNLPTPVTHPQFVWVPVGFTVLNDGTAVSESGFHVCIKDHVTGANPPLAGQSTDQWHWVSY